MSDETSSAPDGSRRGGRAGSPADDDAPTDRHPTTTPTSASDPVVVHVDDHDDPRLADYLDLADAAQRRRRERDEFLIVEGPVALAKLVTLPLAIRSVLTTPKQLDRVTALVGQRAPILVVDAEMMRATVGYDLHRGIVASAARPAALRVADTCSAAASSGRLLVLEGLNDFENVGLITRTAAALGTGAMVLDPTCLDPYYRRSVRVSMGEVLRMPIARSTSWPGDLDIVRAAGFEVWALTPGTGSESLWDVPVPSRVALLAGAEGPGLTAGALAAADRLVRIPIDQRVDSLNVGHATAIALAALTR